jgi:YVTN family beta-propeller protein
MRHNAILVVLLVATSLVGVRYAFAGQAPAAASDPDIPISHQDRVYSAEQFSNTVSVTDPVDNKLVGTIRLGDPLPASCWCTAWGFRLITAPSPLSQSARMR